MQKCAVGKASAFAASVCVTHPALGSCMENTASVTTSPAPDSEGSCVEVSYSSNDQKCKKIRVPFDLTKTAVCREECM